MMGGSDEHKKTQESLKLQPQAVGRMGQGGSSGLAIKHSKHGDTLE